MSGYRSGLLLFLLAWIAPVGCGGGVGENAVVELGRGESRFMPLEDGERLPLVPGSQGGYHVWVSFRSWGLQPDRVDLTLTTELRGVDGSEGEAHAMINLQPREEGGGHVFPGWPARVRIPECAHDRELRIEVSLTDRSGARASDARVVIVEAPEWLRETDASCP